MQLRRAGCWLNGLATLGARSGALTRSGGALGETSSLSQMSNRGTLPCGRAYLICSYYALHLLLGVTVIGSPGLHGLLETTAGVSTEVLEQDAGRGTCITAGTCCISSSLQQDLAPLAKIKVGTYDPNNEEEVSEMKRNPLSQDDVGKKHSEIEDMYYLEVAGGFGQEIIM
ncbi:hypothetical protein Y1Q_0016545 [Alligator mississippiensis]|uniref:Uncharacterized protein n=1 Tax=Alligator mississippiensis TaxID=8496 RepID=A0A151N372_ALLMI|nr:hypothetical protein Y1Q_0016545 [Alligator mississippiensis]